MMLCFTRVTLLCLMVLGSPPFSAQAGVIRYFAKTSNRGEMRLVGVTVERDGRRVTFDADRLIRVHATHFKATDCSNIVTVAGSAPPSPGQRGALLSDLVLNTGLINPGGLKTPLATGPRLTGDDATPGLAIEFDEPVVNLPGDDVVVFELHRELGSPIAGDAFHVSPLSFESGLHSITIPAFDIPCNDPRALPLAGFDLYRFKKPVTSLADLESQSIVRGNGVPTTDFQVLPVSIDLSAMGYADGARVPGLFIQDADVAGLQVDPVLIAGLPAPETPNLLAKIPKDVLAGPEPDELLKDMLAGPLEKIERIVYAERVCGFDHWYANFGYYSASVPEYPPQRGMADEQLPPLFKKGGRLCTLDLRTRKRTVLLDDPDGGVRDPQVSYDARKILFSYRRGELPYYHLYEINVDGSHLTQLTDGPFDDIEPSYLPDGTIVFSSSRCNRFVNCYRTPVATLYRCDADGGNIHPVSTNIEHDNTPWPMPDGRVLYMRWEYVDRSQFSFHHLWTANPDGTGVMVFYGNQQDGVSMLDAKPIPGTDQVVASFSPGHGVPGHMGAITLIDGRTGPDALQNARRISQPGKLYRDPFPITAACYFVADKTGILLMDGRGHTELLQGNPKDAPGLSCHEPRPIVVRPREPVIPSRTVSTEKTGQLVLQNIYHGRNLSGVERGDIKKLLILEQLPKPINFSGGMWPISVGGTFTLARILGTVPVAEDGSACFTLPARRPVFFVALDENDLSVKRMQSFTSVEPGETTGCVGCHEHRSNTPFPDLSAAALNGKTPATIRPIDDVPDVLDYPRDIQPILDRHCLQCHQPGRLDGGIDLSGDHTPLFCVSYWTMMEHGLIADGRNERYGNRPPRSIGSGASRLMTLMDGSHYDVRLNAIERKTIRLWIDCSAIYAGTYAALGSGMHPVEFPIPTMERRCGECHGVEPPTRRIGTGLYFRFDKQGPALPLVHKFTELQQIRGSIGYYKFGSSRPAQSLCNLTHPDKSKLLQAPLSRSAGGLGLCESAGKAVFQSASDPDYQTIKQRIQSASERHRMEKRFDMPDFQPNVYYIRKMQEYGILSADLPADAHVDPYTTDRRYWQSFWP